VSYPLKWSRFFIFGICPKFVSPGYDGMPDRIVLLPKGKFAFVEVKAKNKKPSFSQYALLRIADIYVERISSSISPICSSSSSTYI